MKSLSDHTQLHMEMLVVLILLISMPATEAVDEPFTYIVSADLSSCFFVMDRGEVGRCYCARSADYIELLWSTKGWYAFPEELILTPDGISLIRIPTIISGPNPSKESVFLQFYNKGRGVRDYNLGDLKIDPRKLGKFFLTPERKIVVGGEHGATLATHGELAKILSEERNVEKIASRRKSESGAKNSFLLVETIDGQRFVFDPRSGDMLVRETRPNK